MVTRLGSGSIIGDSVGWDGTSWGPSGSSHVAVTVAGAPLTLATQAITFNKDGTQFDVSGNNLILKAAGHGSAQHDYTTLYQRYIYDAICGKMAQDVSNTVGVAGKVFLTPIVIPRTLTIDAIGYVSLTPGAGNVTLGLYNAASDIPDAQTVACAGAAVSSNASGPLEVAVSDTALTAGLYFHAIEPDNTAMAFARNVNVGATVITAKFWGCYYNRSGGYGALTNPCPATTADYDCHHYGFVRVKAGT